MTTVDAELFMIRHFSKAIEVYDSESLSFIRSWNLKEFFRPFDIASSNRYKYIYVLDKKYPGEASEILSVDPNGRLRNKWSIGEHIWGRLSVTDESHVILSLIHTNRLIEYSPDGQLIREIQLSSDAGLDRLWRSIKLTDRHFVVFRGDERNSLQRVDIVNVRGGVMKSFDGKTTASAERGPLNDLSHSLAVGDDGSILVADESNGRVLLLSFTLEFKKEILSREEHGLRFPVSIHLDQSSGRLIVADYGYDEEERIFIDGRILNYKIYNN